MQTSPLSTRRIIKQVVIREQYLLRQLLLLLVIAIGYLRLPGIQPQLAEQLQIAIL